MLPARDAADALAPGFGGAHLLSGDTYRDCATAVFCATRGLIHPRVVASWLALTSPRNSRRGFHLASGDEVAVAYNRLTARFLATPALATCPYVLTLEDDCIVPPDLHLRLLESIGGFDAVSALYHQKSPPHEPVAYGDPRACRASGRAEFFPRDLRGGGVVPCVGIGMGAALWRADLFRELPPPWFLTRHEPVPEPDGGPTPLTQDLYWCKRLFAAGKSVAVDCRVRVGHLDVDTGEVF